MSTQTTNYGLVKDDANEYYDIEKVNANLDAIDTQIKAVNTKADGKVSHSLATAVNDFLVASAAGQFVKKTLAEVKTILGLGSAAYQNSSATATANTVVLRDANGRTQAADPSAAADVATKAYVDARFDGISNKTSVVAATTVNIALSGLQTIDGKALVAGDRVLVKNQTTASQNGIYIVAAGAWTRAADADISAEVKSGLFVFVQSGTVNGSNGFTLTTPDPIILATTNLTFVQTSGAGQIIDGAGLSKTGNQLNVNVDNSTLEISSDALRLKDGGTTDAKLGNRTITDTNAPTADGGLLTTLFSNIGYMIKSITGKSSWRTTPATTLEAVNTHIATDMPLYLKATRNTDWVGGGQLKWGVVANTFSWSSPMYIQNYGGKLLIGGAALSRITIAAGSVVLANAWDCAYITIPSADAQTVTISVAQYNAITGNDKLILAVRDSDNCLELRGGLWLVYEETVAAGGKRDQYIPSNLATAANDFVVASGAGAWVKKTLSEVKTILGLGSAAYTNSSAYATAAQGTKADNAATQASLDTHLSDYVRQPGYAVTTGSANSYVLALNPAPTSYTDGMGIVVKINAANTGAATLNVNGLGAKAIVDSKGNALTSGKLRLNGTYSLKYNSTSGNFILQGEGGSGNATASDLLSGKTASVDAGDITGAMPDRTGVTSLQLTPLPGGAGSIDFMIPGGGYAEGVTRAYINDPDFVAANIRADRNIFGLQGAIPNRSGVYQQSVATDGAYTGAGTGRIYMKPPQGYYDEVGNSYVYAYDPNWSASNVPQGISMFGLAGTNTNKPQASGSATTSSSYIVGYRQDNSTGYIYPFEVTGLTFKPRVIEILYFSIENRIATYYEDLSVDTYDAQFTMDRDNVYYRCDVANNLYVTTGAFKLALHLSNTALTWRAWA